MLPSISFETGRKHKLNLLFKTTRWSETANGSLVLYEIGTTTERSTHAARNQKELCTRVFVTTNSSRADCAHSKPPAG